MNEKAQALIEALRNVGVSVTHWDNIKGQTQIEIARCELRGENDHFKWCLGDNNGFAFVIDANGQIKDITE